MRGPLKFGSLFTGVGGFDLGFEGAGMEGAWQVEIDKHCRNVLRKQFSVEIHEDVKEVGKENIGSVDVICAGVPCQDVSVAGRRKGLAGERTGLFFEFERIVSELQPEWFVFENVPGLLSSNERRDFATVLGKLGQCGYLQAFRILNSQYWRVAQRRRRVFIVGHLRGTGAIEVLFEPEGLPWNPQKSEEEGERATGDVAGSLRSGGDGGIPSSKGDNLIAGPIQSHQSGGMDRSVDNPDSLIVGPLSVNSGPNGHDAGNFSCNQGVDSGHIIAATETGAGFWTEGKPRLRATTAPSQPQTILAFHSRQDPVSLENKALPLESSIPQSNAIAVRTAQTGANGIGVSEEKSHTLDEAQGQAVAFKQNTRNELIESEKHPSLSSGGGKPGQGYPCVRQGMTVRRLTPKECERLQGFPDDFTRYAIDDKGKEYEQSDTQRYRQMGNAVTVTVAEWIAKRIERETSQQRLPGGF